MTRQSRYRVTEGRVDYFDPLLDGYFPGESREDCEDEIKEDILKYAVAYVIYGTEHTVVQLCKRTINFLRSDSPSLREFQKKLPPNELPLTNHGKPLYTFSQLLSSQVISLSRFSENTEKPIDTLMQTLSFILLISVSSVALVFKNISQMVTVIDAGI